MGQFQLHAPFSPRGDQEEAIGKLAEGVARGDRFQTLLGVTGSGKTYTCAQLIAATDKPALVIAHNKTLAAQLCQEFRTFFPKNAVEYFISYYDYYQPEAYLPQSDTYIEKDASINDEIDRLRHSTTQALLTRSDVIVVASVSCIYNLGSPELYEQASLPLSVGGEYARSELLRALVDMQYERNDVQLTRGTFRARGDLLQIVPSDQNVVIRCEFEFGVLTAIQLLDPVTYQVKESCQSVRIFPATHYVTLPRTREEGLAAIEEELAERTAELEGSGKLLEAQRLKQRTDFDLEMIRTMGYCSGIENYSRHFDGRAPGDPPRSLLDYFPKDYLIFIDESHVTLPQLRGMYEGDRSRKETLVEYGFRLPSAFDNRPLQFEEFLERVHQAVFVSATPGLFEKEKSIQIVEQIVRPTGLLDPEIVVRPAKTQVDNLLTEIPKVVERGGRVLVTTLTKKMAEGLTQYLMELGVRAQYLHSDVKSLDRVEVLRSLRRGDFDVLVGINLLREGLDLPEVSLVAILDADKEGFLRSETSLIQTMGRAARHVHGQVFLYADRVTGSMQRAISETTRRREKQLAYNRAHGIVPRSIVKPIADIVEGIRGVAEPEESYAAFCDREFAMADSLERALSKMERELKRAAKELQFERAAALRDQIQRVRKKLGREPLSELPKSGAKRRKGKMR